MMYACALPHSPPVVALMGGSPSFIPALARVHRLRKRLAVVTTKADWERLVPLLPHVCREKAVPVWIDDILPEIVIPQAVWEQKARDMDEGQLARRLAALLHERAPNRRIPASHLVGHLTQDTGLLRDLRIRGTTALDLATSYPQYFTVDTSERNESSPTGSLRFSVMVNSDWETAAPESGKQKHEEGVPSAAATTTTTTTAGEEAATRRDKQPSDAKLAATVMDAFTRGSSEQTREKSTHVTRGSVAEPQQATTAEAASSAASPASSPASSPPAPSTPSAEAKPSAMGSNTTNGAVNTASPLSSEPASSSSKYYKVDSSLATAHEASSVPPSAAAWASGTDGFRDESESVHEESGRAVMEAAAAHGLVPSAETDKGYLVVLLRMAQLSGATDDSRSSLLRRVVDNQSRVLRAIRDAPVSASPSSSSSSSSPSSSPVSSASPADATPDGESALREAEDVDAKQTLEQRLEVAAPLLEMALEHELVESKRPTKVHLQALLRTIGMAVSHRRRRDDLLALVEEHSGEIGRVLQGKASGEKTAAE